MSFPFPSEEWLEAFVEAINNSPAYEKSAKSWEGDFYLIIEPGKGDSERMLYYLDLWHGKARSACVVADESDKTPEFVIRAPVTTWQKVIQRKLDPIQGMVTGRLKLSGTLSKIMRMPKAASELVNCATKVPTEFSS